ncbi:MAG TPA: hypothetical protein DCG90_13970 [Sphingobium sp.]|nr:hypothetical protein [Sphingobium sp.]
MQTWKTWRGNLIRWIRPKSNGMPVRRRTAAQIRAGDTARVGQNWSGAAHHYRQALSIEPHLYHLWVQLGHMEKEAGAIDRAAAAYEEAARLGAGQAEPLLHLGHMAKAWQQPDEAARHFVRALQRKPQDLQAISELARVMPDREAVDSTFWAAALAALGIAPNMVLDQEVVTLSDAPVLFDVTDLLAFFGRSRLPTGIQRVQIEISLALLDDAAAHRAVFCGYSSSRRSWIMLPRDKFFALCRLAKQSDDAGDPAWVAQLVGIYRAMATARTLRLPAGTTLVNLGTSWSDRNYLLDVRTLRARVGMIYVPLVFDLIPLIDPTWFIGSLVRDYRAWFTSLLHSADGYLAISRATRQDLLDKSVERQAAIPSETVSVVALDGDFRQNAADRSILRDYALGTRPFVLLVSTLEPRKNHIGAFQAWVMLRDRLDEADMPDLVCVGGRGWLNDAIHRTLRHDPALRQRVHILHGVPDDRLATLYENCLFALYPSFYEGWGLPVSEALSYGKVPAISAVSSLPEAGGRFARYFDPHDPATIADAVCALLDKPVRDAAEAAITAGYKPRTWHHIAYDLLGKAVTVQPRGEAGLPLVGGPGIWSLLSDSGMQHDDAPGEVLRHGHGWGLPTATGCRIAGDDVSLWFRWAGCAGGVLHIHVAADHGGAPIGIDIHGYSSCFEGRAGEPLVLSLPLPARPGPVRIGLAPPGGGCAIAKLCFTCD